jgi:hypothetical protein
VPDEGPVQSAGCASILASCSTASGKIGCGFLAEIKFAEFLPEAGRFAFAGIPPSPPYIGIIVLERNCLIIYGAQSLAGKILMSKNLRAGILMTANQNGTIQPLWTVTASTMITRFRLWRKVGCHSGWCGLWRQA